MALFFCTVLHPAYVSPRKRFAEYRVTRYSFVVSTPHPINAYRRVQSNMTLPTSTQPIGSFIKALAGKQPTPGGGAAAAVGAALGAAAAHMSAVYTQRPRDRESGAALTAQSLMERFLPAIDSFLEGADKDAEAYQQLQRTWKEPDMDPTEKASIQARALQVPTDLLEKCHGCIVEIDAFLPLCNRSITSDAKVGIHQLAGAARAAYQTVLVNSPSREEKDRLRTLLDEIRTIEDKLLED